jgi:hypothetical protein
LRDTIDALHDPTPFSIVLDYALFVFASHDQTTPAFEQLKALLLSLSPIGKERGAGQPRLPASHTSRPGAADLSTRSRRTSLSRVDDDDAKRKRRDTPQKV